VMTSARTDRDPGSGIRDPIASRTPDPASRVAIVHDWLTGMRGGEKVLEAICELYPEATLYTLVHVRGSVSSRIERHRIRRSPIHWLPRAADLYRNYLPLFPAAVELFDLDRYDLVISSSHCAVKSVIRRPGATHVCYCHSPMRYAWDQFGAYFGPDKVGPRRSRMLRPILARLSQKTPSTIRPTLDARERLAASKLPLQLTVRQPQARAAAGNKPGRGIVVGEAADVALIELTQQRNQPMTTTTRIGLGLSAALVSLSLALAPAAFAQDKMGKDDGMKKDSMSRDAMKKDDGMTKKDGMKHDGMMKDGMKKDDGMKKN